MTLELDDELCNTSRMHIHVHTSSHSKHRKRSQNQHGEQDLQQNRYNARTSLNTRHQGNANPDQSNAKMNAQSFSPDLSFSGKVNNSKSGHSGNWTSHTRSVNNKVGADQMNKYDSDDDARQHPQQHHNAHKSGQSMNSSNRRRDNNESQSQGGGTTHGNQSSRSYDSID